MNRYFILIILVILVFFANAEAQNEKQKKHELEEIVVTATGKSKMLNTPASISIITAEDLANTGAKNIIEALEKIPGVINTTYNNDGIAIRGTQSSMAGGPVILIDGVAQKMGNTRYDSFSFIPVSQVERIEVLRSPGIVYGPGSARGVINIITKKGGKEKFSCEIKSSYGSWNTTDSYATVFGKKERWDYLINAGYFNTDGYEDEKEDKSSGLIKLGFNPNEYTRIGIRGNLIENDFEMARGFEKKQWQLDNYRREKHFPVSETDPTLIWHNEKEQDESVFAFEFSHDKDNLFIDSNISWTKYEEKYISMYNLYTEPSGIYYDDKDQDTYAFNFSGGYNFKFGDISYTVSSGVNFENIQFDQTRTYSNDPDKNTDKYDFDVDSSQYGLFLDNDFLFSEKVGLKIGVRADQVKVEFEDKVPTKVDQDETLIGWSVAPSYYFTQHANIYFQVSKNFWMPTPAYYAWAAAKGEKDDIVINSPENLEPEESLTCELGYKHMVDKALNFVITGFFIDYKDKFGSVYHDNSKMSWGGIKNIGDAEMKGIELEIDGLPIGWFGYRFSGTWLDAEWSGGQMKIKERPGNTSVLKNLDGYQIHGIPEYSCVIGLDFYPVSNLKVNTDINYYGSTYADYTNRIKYESKTTVDAKISYSINNSWKIWVLGKNIFDEEIEKINNTTGKINTSTGEYDNNYYVQDGAYFEAGLSYQF